jgi:peptidylprolyl isomerase
MLFGLVKTEKFILIYFFYILIKNYELMQAKKSKEDLKEVTNKVYFDVEIDGKAAGM